MTWFSHWIRRVGAGHQLKGQHHLTTKIGHHYFNSISCSNFTAWTLCLILEKKNKKKWWKHFNSVDIIQYFSKHIFHLILINFKHQITVVQRKNRFGNESKNLLKMTLLNVSVQKCNCARGIIEPFYTRHSSHTFKQVILDNFNSLPVRLCCTILYVMVCFVCPLSAVLLYMKISRDVLVCLGK